MNEYVQNKVNAPGLALAVFGGVCILLNLISGAFQLLSAITSIMSLVTSDVGMEAWVAFGMSQGWTIVLALIAFASSFVVLFAGMRLRQARSPGLVYAGSIFAMLPCCVSGCCCLGLPLGIWAIVTMQDEQVKVAFAEA